MTLTRAAAPHQMDERVSWETMHRADGGRLAAPKKGRSRGGRRSPLGNDLPAGSAASTEQTDRALVLHPSEDLLDELRAGRRHLSRQVAQGELLHLCLLYTSP